MLCIDLKKQTVSFLLVGYNTKVLQSFFRNNKKSKDETPSQQ